MPRTKAAFRTVDEYIDAQPEPAREFLARVRAAIRKAVPRAEESISYNMAGYKLDGHPLIYFAGWKKHYSLYPAGARLTETFKKELAPYEVEKSTIRLPLSPPVPTALISRIARFRAREVTGE